jgi:uncharacterized protein (DUF169 family)
MNHQDLAREIAARLGLANPPIAIAFVEEPPPGVVTSSLQVPAACAFWRRAESEVFYAPAESHYHCPVGAMTMGFEIPPALQQDLEALVGKMCDCGYLLADEPAGIPTVSGRLNRGIVYGPLGSFPMPPDLMLIWITPRQAMLFGEAVGSSRWARREAISLFGRPACAALPAALKQGGPTLSTGCMGMRTFTEIGEDRLLAVIPGGEIETFYRNLVTTLEVNETMRAHYEQHKAQFTA